MTSKTRFWNQKVGWSLFKFLVLNYQIFFLFKSWERYICVYNREWFRLWSPAWKNKKQSKHLQCDHTQWDSQDSVVVVQQTLAFDFEEQRLQ